MAQSVAGGVETKVCRQCGSGLPLSAFNKAPGNRDGLNNSCKGCKSAYGKQYYAKNKDLVLERSADRYAEKREVILERRRERYEECKPSKLAANAAWRLGNADRMREYSRKSHAKNREKRNAASAVWRAKNRGKHLAAVASWQSRNKGAGAGYTAARRAAKRASVAIWADSEFEQLAIREAYHLASLRSEATGIEHHVDHIVPLKGRTVCGLHCSSNLRVIPARVNMVKGARTWPGMP